MSGVYVPAGEGLAELTEKRSRFIGRVRPVEREEEARAFIERVKKEQHGARHNCWCYLLPGGPERYSDDGEPQGTAGLPMLEVFRRAEVTGAVCVVTRYFGGVLLGAGGLLRAYTKAAKDALDAAGRAAARLWNRVAFRCPYPLAERLKLELAAAGGAVETVDYAADVVFRALVPEEALAVFAGRVTELSGGSVALENLGTVRQAARPL